ncbi:MAG: DUF5320 family protein [Nanoarchaeota archaeon]|nr:DUF5320 family protein [Nanoarchaeota archaeon]
MKFYILVEDTKKDEKFEAEHGLSAYFEKDNKKFVFDLGQGSMTGRRDGYCAGNSAPCYANPLPKRGMAFDRRRGMGRGFRRMAFAPVTPVDRVVPVYPAQQPTNLD